MDEVADRLMQEFYLSDSYDPNAARPADTVKAAIGFALRHSHKALVEYREQIANEVVARRVADGSLSEPLDYTDWEEVSGEVESRMRREGLMPLF